MDIFTSALVIGSAGAAVIGGSLAYGRILMVQAVARVKDYEDEADELISRRTFESLERIDAYHRQEVQRVSSFGPAYVSLLGEKETLEEMVEDLRQERDNLSTELAAMKVDAVEQSSIADAYAKQTGELDQVVADLTDQLSARGVGLKFYSEKTQESHLEAMIRIGLRQSRSRGAGTIGRASELEAIAA